MRSIVAALFACALFAAPAQAAAFRIATAGEAIDVVTADDAHARNMTPSDLSIRLQVRDGGDIAALRARWVEGLRQWSAAERARLDAMVARNADRLATVDAWLPETVLFVKTSESYEGGLPHTRGHTILFGDSLPADDAKLDELFFHELFHIMSRRAPQAARAELYALIGFDHCTRLDLPPALRAKRLSNPDVEDGAYTVDLQNGDEIVSVMPLIVANPDRWSEARPQFRDYIRLLFVRIHRVEGGGCTLAAITGQPSFFDAGAMQQPLMTQVGRNTAYILHPEETLADNFAYMMLGRTDLPDMWVIEKLKARLDRGP